MRVVALAGGVGGSKLVLGLYGIMAPSDLTVIANTGDDIVMHGLHISPDPDILTYTLAGLVNPETGWGFRDESFRALEGLKTYGRTDWFKLGDRDLATHIHRTAIMREGGTLSQAMESIRIAHGVKAQILPMSDRPVPTMLETDEGRMHLQEYFVRRKCEPRLRAIAFVGASDALPAPGVLEALNQADAIIICPSNPLISIGPILAIPLIAEALRRRRAQTIAVSPLVGGKSLKGPSDKMMAELGLDVSVAGVAAIYRDFCSAMIVDAQDAGDCAAVAALGLRPVLCQTVMRSLEDKRNLARAVLHAASSGAA